MTQPEIEAFLAVVKYGTLSSAAQKLFITQPALTRRIQLMEEELGYPLFVRQKGRREIQLTEQGTKFRYIAWKWQRLWEETSSIRDRKYRESLAVACTDSASNNIFSSIFVEFTQRGYLLQIYNTFSETAYQFMEKGIYELAFIAMQDYTQPLPAGTQIHPAYAESFVVVSFEELPNRDGIVELPQLRENQEVYLAWNKEFKAWHEENFDELIPPIVSLEHYAESRFFLKGDAWMLAPYATGEHYRQLGARIYDLATPPPRQIIYYLTSCGKKDLAVRQFLDLLKERLREMPEDKVQSFLG